MKTPRGKIIFFNTKSKFGFIQNYEDDQKYYVHEKNVIEHVKAEDEVEFELRPAKRGMEAIKVRKYPAKLD